MLLLSQATPTKATTSYKSDPPLSPFQGGRCGTSFSRSRNLGTTSSLGVRRGEIFYLSWEVGIRKREVSLPSLSPLSAAVFVSSRNVCMEG